MTTYFMREPLEEEDIEEIWECWSNIKNNISRCCESIVAKLFIWK